MVTGNGDHGKTGYTEDTPIFSKELERHSIFNLDIQLSITCHRQTLPT